MRDILKKIIPRPDKKKEKLLENPMEGEDLWKEIIDTSANFDDPDQSSRGSVDYANLTLEGMMTGYKRETPDTDPKEKRDKDKLLKTINESGDFESPDPAAGEELMTVDNELDESKIPDLSQEKMTELVKMLAGDKSKKNPKTPDPDLGDEDLFGATDDTVAKSIADSKTSSSLDPEGDTQSADLINFIDNTVSIIGKSPDNNTTPDPINESGAQRKSPKTELSMQKRKPSPELNPNKPLGAGQPLPIKKALLEGIVSIAPQTPILKIFSEEEIEELLSPKEEGSLFQARVYTEGEKIFQQGEKSNGLIYFLIQGEVVIIENGKRISTKNKWGDIFGDINAVFEKRDITAIAEKKSTVCLSLDINNVDKIPGHKLLDFFKSLAWQLIKGAGKARGDLFQARIEYKALQRIFTQRVKVLIAKDEIIAEKDKEIKRLKKLLEDQKS